MKDDMFFEDSEKKLNKKKIVMVVIVFVLIVLIAVFGTLYEKNKSVRNFFDKYIFAKEKYENDFPKIFIDSDSSQNIFAYKNNILILKNNVLTFYNKNGHETDTVDVEISNPIFKSSGNYICIAEKQGKKIYVLSDKNVVWQKELEGNISNIAINENGYLAVAITGETYKTVIKTFDNKGTGLFTQFFSSTYILDMDISQDNKYLALAEVNLSGILIQSNIKITSMEKAANEEKDSTVYTKAGNAGDLIISLKYQNKDLLTCVYDNHIETIKDGQDSTVADFSKEDIYFADINNKIIKVEKTKSQVYLQITNPNTNTTKEYEIDEPKEIYVSNDVIAVNLGSEVQFYSNSGWLINRYYANQEISKIVLSDNLAGVIYNDKVELISL